MSRYQALSSDVVKSLFNGPGVYQLAFSFEYGMTMFHTFIGGIIQFRTLPRQQFGNLQSRIFPVYFGVSTSITTALLASWVFNHPDVVPNFSRPGLADVAQAWTLVVVGSMQALNWLYLGPLTSSLMFKRHKLERAEGKSYTDPTVSDEMKALTKKFGALHGISSLTNLISILGMTFHGLWIAKYGTKGY
ncbi:hypothetical protein FRC04_002891 [Tulasnella sp. 424]|nr:hypothetical protein FRC04_002891 [Tulasnella sp. 424]KAG8981243.1 hypothetical protein FRC05_004145 [Tulasnella sp. 425]